MLKVYGTIHNLFADKNGISSVKNIPSMTALTKNILIYMHNINNRKIFFNAE